MKVMIATPVDDRKLHCWKEFVKSIKKLGADEVVICDTSKHKEMKPYIEDAKFTYLWITERRDMDTVVSARNVLRNYFIDHDFDYILYIDADIICPENALTKLLSDKKHIVTAMCPILSGNAAIPIASAKILKDDNYYCFPIECMDNMLHKVDLIGMGCCMISREVMEDYRFRCERDSKKFLLKGEDCCFSEDLRDRYTLFFDTDVCTKHKILGAGHWDYDTA